MSGVRWQVSVFSMICDMENENFFLVLSDFTFVRICVDFSDFHGIIRRNFLGEA